MATEAQRPERTRDQIEADLAAARARLGHSVEQLIDQVHPTRIKQRQIAGLKDWVTAEVENAKAQFVNEDGKVRTERLAVIGGAVAGFVTFVVIVRAIVRKRKS
ncbi:DUF3618 domain-containing protein [Microlunatus sp. GCM10028923]|uniref:DUF3618 domain-containing protein n=1 Tax=Microlunatus sp. GCM10028923 TaxID=3273400 RepID=UPI0036083667